MTRTSQRHQRKGLILAGTKEARDLIETLSQQPDDLCISFIASLAGATTSPNKLLCPTRVGGFGGVAGLIDFLQTERIDLVIDATHPFAHQMTEHAIKACKRTDIPMLRYERTAWEKPDGASWLDVESEQEAANILPEDARAFVTIGRQKVAPFLARTDIWCLIRSIEEMPNASLQAGCADPNGRIHFITQSPPYELEDELELMKAHKISHLITKNAGGSLTYAKIKAAMQLSIPIVMIRRPSIDNLEVTTEQSQVLLWLKSINAGRN